MKDNHLLATLVVPRGGSFSLDFIDLMGRKLMPSQTLKDYEIGTHRLVYPLTNLSKGIYIVNYTLNGKNQSIKLGH